MLNDNTALILEGGGLRGVFTCGVLDCFLDHGIRFPLTVGVIAGNWAFKRIPGRLFTYLVYAYIGISGAIILSTTIFK